MIMSRGLATALALALLALLVPPYSSSIATQATVPPALNELAKQSLARLDGDLRVPGLKAPVQILRDQQGIPHIYAQNDDDMFFAQGYVMGQDRLWQLEMGRRGRAGGRAGMRAAKAYDFDARTGLVMFRGPWDEKEWGSYHPDAERLFTAWANGLNAFVAQNASNLPVEFKLTGIKPEPWTARTLTLRWAELGLDSAGGTPLEEIRLAREVARLGAAEANKRAAPDPWDDLVVPEGLDVSIMSDDLVNTMRRGDGNPFAPGVLPPLEIVPQYRDLVGQLQVARVSPEPQDLDGSNNWVVSGRLSPTGVPILSNDPHRTIEMPSLRYFVHLVSPGRNGICGGAAPFVGCGAGCQ